MTRARHEDPAEAGTGFSSVVIGGPGRSSLPSKMTCGGLAGDFIHQALKSLSGGIGFQA